MVGMVWELVSVWFFWTSMVVHGQYGITGHVYWCYNWYGFIVCLF